MVMILASRMIASRDMRTEGGTRETPRENAN